MNEVLITALEGAAEKIGREKVRILRSGKSVKISLSGDGCATQYFEIIGTDGKITLLGNLILPGLLRYLAGELGWVISVKTIFPASLNRMMSYQADCYKCSPKSDDIIHNACGVVPDQLTAEIHAFAAIVERMKKER